MDFENRASLFASAKQDEALIQAGLQKSPAQLLARVETPTVDENAAQESYLRMPARLSCDECRLRRVVCSHNNINVSEAYPGLVIHSTEYNELRQPDRQHLPLALLGPGLWPTVHGGGGECSANRKSSPTLTPHKRGRPSRWKERRAAENAKIAKPPDFKTPIIKQETVEEELGKESQRPARKKGKPKGWKRELGLSYIEYRQRYGDGGFRG